MRCTQTSTSVPQVQQVLWKSKDGQLFGHFGSVTDRAILSAIGAQPESRLSGRAAVRDNNPVHDTLELCALIRLGKAVMAYPVKENYRRVQLPKVADVTWHESNRPDGEVYGIVNVEGVERPFCIHPGHSLCVKPEPGTTSTHKIYWNMGKSGKVSGHAYDD